MTDLTPGADHVAVPYDKPGLCPECLNLWSTGRGGGKVQLVERDGKWFCPRGGPSLVEQLGPDDLKTTANLGTAMSPFALPTIALGVGGGWWLSRFLRRRSPSKVAEDQRQEPRQTKDSAERSP
jgi:hypothetical protein